MFKVGDMVQITSIDKIKLKDEKYRLKLEKHIGKTATIINIEDRWKYTILFEDGVKAICGEKVIKKQDTYYVKIDIEGNIVNDEVYAKKPDEDKYTIVKKLNLRR